MGLKPNPPRGPTPSERKMLDAYDTFSMWLERRDPRAFLLAEAVERAVKRCTRKERPK